MNSEQTTHTVEIFIPVYEVSTFEVTGTTEEVKELIRSGEIWSKYSPHVEYTEEDIYKDVSDRVFIDGEEV